MQKKFFGLTVLLLFIAGAMFAQDLKFDGYLNTGLGVVFSDEEDSDPYVKAIANDAEHYGYRFRLNGSYTNEAKNAGARFRFQSQTTLDPSPNAGASSGYFTLPYAYGWVSFLDNMLTVNGGIVEDSTWSTGDWWLASDSVSHFTGLGVLLKATPVDGLALGVGGYAINRRSGGNNNILNNSNLQSATLLENMKWTFHGAYTMKDMFRIGLSFRTANQAGTDDAMTPDLKPGLSGDQASMLYGEFRYLGVKDLTAVVATRIEGITYEKFGDEGTMVFSETFGYKIDQINFGLNAVQFLYNAEKTDASLLFNLWGSYTIDNIIPRIDLVYFMNGKSNLVGGDTWHRHAFTAQSDDNHRSVFSVRPSVKINLDSRTFLEIGDMINYDFADEKVYGDDKARITNAFYVDLKWSF